MRLAARAALPAVCILAAGTVVVAGDSGGIGREVSVPHHLQDGEEYDIPIQALVRHGRDLFTAMWTVEEGGGRPQTKGTGAPLSDPSDRLVFPRNFNRASAPDANSCYGCHNQPFDTPGGGGDIVANVFVLGQRFDFATFDATDGVPTRGGADENGDPVTLQDFADSRATLGMFGAGYIEMLARQMSAELEVIRDAIPPGGSADLVTKGISFGRLSRRADGSWDTSGVEGLPAPSVRTSGPSAPPDLLILPFHQAGAVVSIRQFTNSAYNQHHGIQSEERFGQGVDADGDGFVDELTRADVTAVSVYQATLPVPGRVIPRDRTIEQAVWKGEQLFGQVGCASCHVPRLPLDDWGWIFREPNPYNPAGNLRPGEAPTLSVNLNSKVLPPPRLRADDHGVTWVPAYTDLKLHDITRGPDDPNREKLNMHFAPGSVEFFAGNGRFLTKKLWGAANERPYYHHGLYTTLRQAVEAHAGEAEAAADAYQALPGFDQDCVIEFLKSLQVLPPGTPFRVVDQKGRPRPWPPT